MKYVLISALHLASCLTLGAISAYWMTQDLDAGHQRKLWPYLLGPTALGAITIYQYSIEFFIAKYSGALYEIKPLSLKCKAWLVFCLLALASPMIGFIPWVGNHLVWMLAIAIIASTPSIADLYASSKNQRNQ